MISYEKSKSIVEIFMKNVDADVESRFIFQDDESEARNAMPNPPKVKSLGIRCSKKHGSGNPNDGLFASVDMDFAFGTSMSLNIEKTADFEASVVDDFVRGVLKSIDEMYELIRAV